MFDQVQVGQVLEVSTTNNHFTFREDVSCSVFIAGGIGITPLWSMIQGLAGSAQQWTLHYAARSKSDAAFHEEIQLFAKEHRGVVHFNWSDEAPRLNLTQIIADAPPSAHFYCCGPKRMIDDFVVSTAHVGEDRVHVEYFEGVATTGAGTAFTVELVKSRKSLTVPIGRTILEMVEEAGVEVAYSCREGVCGACEVVVVSGIPDHKDLVLTPEERAKNRSMMICCSGSVMSHLALDL